MAANLHHSSVLGLFDAMPVPMLTFAVNGVVTFANRASKAHPGRPGESMSGQPVVKALLRDITLSKIKMPYAADIELTGGHRLKGQFMPGPVGLDVAFVALAETTAGTDSGRLSLGEIMALLRHEVGPGIRKLAHMLGGLPAGEKSDNLVEAADALNQRLRRLEDLIAVFGDDVMVTNDRIDLVELVRSVCDELRPRALTQRVIFEVSEPTQTIPSLYGCEKLLRRALYECFDNAVTHSRREVSRQQPLGVKIGYLLTGEHVLMTVRNQGALPEEIKGIETREPFARWAAGGQETKTGRLGLPLVQRIVELHGGKVRIASVEDDEVKVMI